MAPSDESLVKQQRSVKSTPNKRKLQQQKIKFKAQSARGTDYSNKLSSIVKERLL